MPHLTLDPRGLPMRDADDPPPRLDRTLVSPLDPSLPPYRKGDVIADKYRVEEVLGCGGMAWVLRATHLRLNLTVALKFLRFEATRETVARFFQEGRVAARMSSEAVTRVLDVDRLADGTPFLVMEYLDGFDLQKLVDEPGWLPVSTAVDFGIQACEGLIAVHDAGIVHRDLKPANLFMTRKRSGSLRMKLIDFGISKLIGGTPPAGHEGPVTSPHALMGSPVYMAPEQMRSTKNVDARADIWSLGVILYELLGGGRSPFEAETLPQVCMRVLRETPEALSAIRPDLPLGLETVVSRCLEKDPSRRYPDAASLAIALAPYASTGGQLRARHMQHPRPSGPASPVARDVGLAPLTSYRPLPPMNPPPMRRSDAPPRRSPPPPAFPPPNVPSDVTRAQPEEGVERRRFDARVAWLAVALWTLAALLGALLLVTRVRTPPPPPVRESAPMGVANRMPDAVFARAPAPSASSPLPSSSASSPSPSAPSSSPSLPTETPVPTEHVYTVEELPLVAPAPQTAHAVPPGRAQTSAPGRSRADDGF